MPFIDAQTFMIIDQIGEHYKTNINNRYMRQAFSQLIISREEWEKIDRLTNQSPYDKVQGYRYWDIYERILAMATFISRVRKDISPNLRNIVGSGSPGPLSRAGGEGPGVSDAIYRDMVISNFDANLDVLADYVHELYLRVASLDKDSHKVKPPVFTRVPGLDAIGKLLVRR